MKTNFQATRYFYKMSLLPESSVYYLLTRTLFDADRPSPFLSVAFTSNSNEAPACPRKLAVEMTCPLTGSIWNLFDPSPSLWTKL